MVYNDLEVIYGTSFYTSLALTDINGNALNLSGYNVRGAVKFRYNDLVPAALFESQILSPVSGLISLSLLPSDTSGLYPSSCVYQIEVYTSGEAIIFPAAQGRVNVQPNVF